MDQGRSGPPPTEPIDWAAAVRAGQALVPTGPKVAPGQARQAVADLRGFSGRAELIVRETTGLGLDLPVAQAVVVDRRGWVQATAEGMALLAAPLTRRLGTKLADTGKTPSARTRAAAGAQLGTLLGFLSGRVLGQYDPMVDSTSGPGRLLLVAPNIIKVEREISADSADFRMWVCLHEGTHRLQFTAVPWLRDHFAGLVASYAEAADLDSAELLGRAVRALSPGAEGSWIERVQTPEQRAVFDALMALMTLLEGHADYVMDAVGPAVVPTVAAIRAGFSARRARTRGPIDRLMRALLGMDLKLSQYVKGAEFVRAVVDAAGMDGFNRVWSSPDTLPTRAETGDPKAWLARVLG